MRGMGPSGGVAGRGTAGVCVGCGLGFTIAFSSAFRSLAARGFSANRLRLRY